MDRGLEDGDVCLAHAWGFMASGVADAPKCIMDCRDIFTRSLALEDQRLQSVCEALSNGSQSKGGLLHALYCCSSQRCGVNNLEGMGRDPNADWFINACQSIGFGSVIDPGPPNPGYVCSQAFLYGAEPHCRQASQQPTAAPSAGVRAAEPSGGLSSAVSPSEGSPSGVFIIEDLGPLVAATGSSSASTRPTATPAPSGLLTSSTQDSMMPAITSVTSSRLPSQAVATGAVADRGHDDDRPGTLSVGDKVTISLSVMAGVIVIVALVAWLLRIRGQKARARRGVSRPAKPISFPEPTESPSPLASPTNSYTSPPLTPPRRLQERRLLMPRALSRQYSQGRNALGSPLSPMQESLDMDTDSSSLAASLTWPTRGNHQDHHRGDSLLSIMTSGAPAINKATEAAVDRQGVGPFCDPQPPPRVYEGPDSPGPPPNRALPKPPTPLLPPISMQPMQRMESHECEKIDENPSPQAAERDDAEARLRAQTPPSKPPRRVRHVRSPPLNRVPLDLLEGS